MKNNLAEEVTSRLKLRDVMEFYGIHFNSRGFAKCPFHTEKTASLSIKREHYKCFGCNAYGGTIDFVMNYFGLKFMPAIMKLNSDFNLGVTGNKPTFRDRQFAAENRRIEIAEKSLKMEQRHHYNGLAVFHREIYKRLCVGENDTELMALQIGLEAWLDDNNGKVVQPWKQ